MRALPSLCLPQLLGLFFLLFLSACSKKSASNDTAAEAAPIPQLTSEKPLTEDRRIKLEAFGEALALSVRENDPDTFAAQFSHFRLGELSIQGVPMVSAKAKRDFLKGFVKGISGKPGGIAHALLGQGYTFLKVFPYQGQHRVLCRLYDDDGINYHAYACEISKKGQVRAIDFYNVAGGESMSESLRRIAILALADQKQSLMTRLLSKSDALVAANFDKLKEFGEFAQAGIIDEGLAAYESLIPELQLEKSVMIMRMQLLAVREKDEGRYVEAMKTYAETFPNDPSLAIMMVDYHLLREDYDKSLASIDALEKEVGADPALDILRANISFAAGNYEQAIRCAEAALTKEPTLEDGHWTAISSASVLADYDRMAKHLTALRDTFDYEFDEEELRANEDYQTFMNTPQASAFFGIAPGSAE